MDTPSPRGRAALIKNLRAMTLGRPGESPTAGAAGAGDAGEQPAPAPRGRAALLSKLKAKQEQVVGSGSPALPKPTETEAKEKTDCSFKGSSGEPIYITANYIEFYLAENKGVFEYELRFKPEMDSKHLRIKLLNAQMSKLGGVKMFDGGNVVYLPVKLPDAKTVIETVNPNDGAPVTMTVTFKKSRRLSECIHLFNVLFKKVMIALQYSRIGRNYFNVKTPFAIPQHRLEVLPGYALAVEEYEGGLMVCVDSQHRVLRVDTAFDLMREAKLTRREQYKEYVRTNLIGSVVLTKYNNKTYMVDDIAWDITPRDTFDKSDGTKATFAEYYKVHYGIAIQDLNQPMLLHTQKVRTNTSAGVQERTVLLVPELCSLTGLTQELRDNFRIMKDIAQFTRVTPQQRMDAMRRYQKNISECPQAQKILSDWGLTMKEATIDLNARVLNPETILFGGKESQPLDSKADWTRGRFKLVTGVDLNNWAIVFIDKDQRLAQEIVEKCTALSNTLGVNIGQPSFYRLANDKTSTYVAECQKLADRNYQILAFIFANQRADLYSALKRICCLQKPIPMQGMLSRTFRNKNAFRTIVYKILVQMQAKLGGVPWSLSFPCKNWMVIGIDVYHSGQGSSKKAFLGFVSSLNDSFTQWHSSTREQRGEISTYLKMCFVKALEAYRDRYGRFPEKIVLFRDGVSEGQLEHCSNLEVPQFEEVLSQFKLTTMLTFVVVQKRIGTRLFAVDSRTRELSNPRPGTVVDTTITKKYMFDFYLVPQHVNQGTVTPTHYIVLLNNANLKPDVLQKLSYKLCHLYYNWSGTIRVPAPCQYAHKLAYLIGNFVGKEPLEELSNKLYYL